jgi:preprotein translocase subunit SecA
LNEYKSEAFDLFNGLIARLREMTISQLMRVEVAFEPPPQQLPPMFASHSDPLTGEDDLALAEANTRMSAGTFTSNNAGFEGGLMVAPRGDAVSRDPQDPASWGRVGRNELCPCGSGKKYKHCHGVIV